jgi:hypothetical protein
VRVQSPLPKGIEVALVTTSEIRAQEPERLEIDFLHSIRALGGSSWKRVLLGVLTARFQVMLLDNMEAAIPWRLGKGGAAR